MLFSRLIIRNHRFVSVSFAVHRIPEKHFFLNYSQNRSSSNQITKMASLNKEEIARYSRQMLCPEIGKSGQLRLKSSSVLVVGAGGLGCPSSLYLTAAGIGRLGLIDSDVVETSNLHRQTLHSESTIGQPKTDSAVDRLRQLNSNVKFEKHQVRLSAENAAEIITNYDIVIDGTDNPMARYLISDVCVLLKKPMVSGSALQWEGQLTVYNYDEETPCYRCLFPQPPAPGTVTNCADGGVIGVVPGIIGNIQALEAIKIAAGLKPSYAGKLLLFDGLSGQFRKVELRKRKDDCISCGNNPTITNELIDYNKFCGIQCGSAKKQEIIDPEERVTAEQYKQVIDSNEPHLLIDVRPQLHYDIVKLDNAISVPLGQIIKGNGVDKITELIDEKWDPNSNEKKKIFVMCRRGIASQKAVVELKKRLGAKIDEKNLEIKDVKGGISEWAEKIDPKMPTY